MSQISSINFKKSITINTEHNDRTLAPSYLIDKEKGAECNRPADQARILKNQLIQDAIKTYQNRTKQRFQAKSYEWSAVVNIKPETTMQDLEKLADHFNDKYGFQCYQIAIHRDEGYINDNNEKVINQHAHLEFITLDKNTGTNKQRELTPQKLRVLQTEVAQILQMERGVDKRISKRERIEPRKYAQMKEKEKKAIKDTKKELNAVKSQNQELEKELKITKKQIKEAFEKVRKESIGKGYNKEYYQTLSKAKKQTLEYIKTQSELDEIIQNFKRKYTKRSFFKEKIDYETLSAKQEKIIKNQAEQLQILKENSNYQEQHLKSIKQEIKENLEKENQAKEEARQLKHQQNLDLLQKNYDEKEKKLEEDFKNKFKNKEQNLIKREQQYSEDFKYIMSKKKEIEKEQKDIEQQKEYLKDTAFIEFEAEQAKKRAKLIEGKKIIEKENETLKNSNFKLKTQLTNQTNLEIEELKLKNENLEKENKKLKADNEHYKTENKKLNNLVNFTNIAFRYLKNLIYNKLIGLNTETKRINFYNYIVSFNNNLDKKIDFILSKNEDIKESESIVKQCLPNEKELQRERTLDL